MLKVSAPPLASTIFSVEQLKGGSILIVIVVGSGPEFWRFKILFIGIEATPFFHIYLKSRRGGSKVKAGVINSPETVVSYTTFGFLSPPIVTKHYHYSLISPTLNELALN